MKNLALFSTFAYMTVVLAGCGTPQTTTKTTETSITTTTTLTTGDTTTVTGETITGMVTTGTTMTGNTINNKTYSLTDLARHNTASDCRTAINGKVYDVTAFFGKHPGGDKNILRTCGIDATTLFNRKHGADTKPEQVLNNFEIGTLLQ